MTEKTLIEKKSKFISLHNYLNFLYFIISLKSFHLFLNE